MVSTRHLTINKRKIVSETMVSNNFVDLYSSDVIVGVKNIGDGGWDVLPVLRRALDKKTPFLVLFRNFAFFFFFSTKSFLKTSRS